MTTTEKSTVDAAATAEAIGGTEDPGGARVRDGLVALAQAATHGRAAVAATLGLTSEAVRIALGRSTVEPAKGDNRFADPSWTDNPGYRRLKQGYLAWSNAVDSVVEDGDVDWRTRERARFAAGILTSSLAPTNTLPGNPAALKRVIETGGGSLVAGARHFVDDLRHNGGMPKQVDPSALKVGENMAATPGRGRLPQRGVRAAAVHADHADRPHPAGPADPTADQQVLLPRHRPRGAASSSTPSPRASSSS